MYLSVWLTRYIPLKLLKYKDKDRLLGQLGKKMKLFTKEKLQSDLIFLYSNIQNQKWGNINR